MKAEAVIHYRLTTHAGVVNLIQGRVHAGVLPQAPVYPCLVYRRVESRRVQGVYTDPGYAFVRVQITCLAKTYEEIKDVAEQVRLALERYGSALTGTAIPTAEAGNVTVYDITLGTEADAYEPVLDVFSHAVDFEVLHAE